WPFADKAIKAVASKVKGILVTELNYGQIVHEVERAVAGACPVELCAKYNMEIFEPQEIEKGIDVLIAGGNK
ncbi:MAG: 2-oxoacid:acceptor oxidoreductase subunit alpha, partial [Selenomonadaceae bacterium]|nr:2-oxoacid:acceptor oxidoreductase subunit alpha [Selenomonadaceae bacterium]